MKNNMKRITVALLMLAMFIPLLPLKADAQVPENESLKLLTDSYISGSGSFTLRETARLFVVSDGEPTGELLQTARLINSEFAAAGLPSGTPLPLVWGDSRWALPGDIVLELVSGIAADGYRLTITSDRLTVSAGDVDGLLNGAFMAMRHFRVYGGKEIPACTVKDEPDTKERTLMLDCARKYWSVKWIKNLIRQMSWMGYNALELHMTEDQGMHMNIWSEGNDCNGNNFSWLCGYKVAYWAADAPDPNGNNNYSAAEIREIVALAQEYHIEVIPSMDVPGHCDYMNTKYANKVASDSSFTFNYGGKTYTADGIVENGVCTPYDTTAYPNAKFNSIRNNSTVQTVDVTNPVGRAFSLAVLQAYAHFFRTLGCTKFNFGCDEVVLDAKVNDVIVDDRWDAYAVSHVSGTYSNYDTIYDYNNEVNRMLLAEGYTGVRAFNEVLYNKNATVSLDSNIGICYWKEPDSNFYSVSKYLNDGRTVYNCANSYTYYVLRYNASQGDARSPSCLQWGFHHSTEDRIYSGCGGTCKCQGVNWNPCYSSSGWNPSKLSCVSNSSEYYYSGSQLGGGYFLIWGDWAGWSTEAQVWEGIDAGGTYNLIDRMWSNTVKMWNWDIEKSLSYNSNYRTLRNLYRLYPGYTSPSADPSIPAASTLQKAVDFTALQAQIAQEPALPKDEYTPESYAAYQTALTSAQSVCNNVYATQSQVDKALAALAEAYNSLKALAARVIYKTMVGANEEIIEETEVDGGEVAMELRARRGYRFLRLEGNATFQPLYSGAEGGVLRGNISIAEPIVIWYENLPQLDILERLLSADDAALAEANADYAAQKQSAQDFYNSVKDAAGEKTTQAAVDGYVNSLIAARSRAVLTASRTEILDIRKTTDYVAAGKSAVLIVTTSPDVSSVTVAGVTLDECQGKLSVTDSGKQVKLWYLSFGMTTAGTETYTVTAVGSTTVTKTIEIICK